MICSFWHFIKSLAGLTRHGTHRACLRLAPTCEMLMRRGASQLVLWESLRWGRWRGGRRAVIMYFVLSTGRPSGALVIHSAAWLWPPRGLRARGCLPSVPKVGHFHSGVKIICNFLARLDACLNMNREAACCRPQLWNDLRKWEPLGVKTSPGSFLKMLFVSLQSDSMTLISLW